MMKNKHFQLMIINPFYLTDSGFGRIKSKYLNNRLFEYSENIPKYSFKDDGTIIMSDCYHQFTGDAIDPNDEDNKNYMFDIIHLDPLLQIEVDNADIDFFSGLNFKPIIDNNINIFTDYEKYTIPTFIRIVFSIEYIGDYYDFDIDVKLIGYLDDKMNLVKI